MTALVQMAAARPPGIADARVPCPLCGGLIHPVAGRCKHCKEDLSSYRAGRPQAATALPALNGKANGTNGHVAAPVAVAISEPIVQETSQPILPPRPTNRPMKAQRGPRMLSWPIIVIALAAIAIVTATVIMIIPPSKKGTSSNKISNPPPAPDRMETNPLPEKHSSTDPWGGSAADPQAQAQPQPQPPMPQAAPDPDDDIWKDLNKGGPGVPNMPSGGDFMVTALDRACKKLMTCPDIDQSMFTSVCTGISALPKPPAKANCPAAERCLEKIDQMSCNQAATGNAMWVVTMFQDCTTAMQC